MTLGLADVKVSWAICAPNPTADGPPEGFAMAEGSQDNRFFPIGQFLYQIDQATGTGDEASFSPSPTFLLMSRNFALVIEV